MLKAEEFEKKPNPTNPAEIPPKVEPPSPADRKTMNTEGSTNPEERRSFEAPQTFWVRLLEDIEPAHEPLEAFTQPKQEPSPAQSAAPQPQVAQPVAEPRQEDSPFMRYLPWILGGLLAVGALLAWAAGYFRRRQDDDGGPGRNDHHPTAPAAPGGAAQQQEQYDGDIYKYLLSTISPK